MSRTHEKPDMNQLLPSPRQFFLIQRALRLMAAPLLDWRVTGLENIPRHGSLLVALNHTSFLDVVLPALFFPRPLVSYAKMEAFRSPLVALLFHWMKMIPVRRGEADRSALECALQILQGGGAFGIAPEGTRTDGSLIRAKTGVGLLAAASGATVLPLAMWGAARGGFAANLGHLRRTRLQAVIGRPLRLRDTSAADRESRQAITDELMLNIARLLPEPMRGCYSNLRDYPMRYFEPLEPEAPRSLPAVNGHAAVSQFDSRSMAASDDLRHQHSIECQKYEG
jgi:1-acyl-sn-glycerol-3-phosphate acyltransferase